MRRHVAIALGSLLLRRLRCELLRLQLLLRHDRLLHRLHLHLQLLLLLLLRSSGLLLEQRLQAQRRQLHRRRLRNRPVARLLALLRLALLDELLHLMHLLQRW